MIFYKPMILVTENGMNNIRYTFLFIEQNLQSDADGGRTWFIISLWTETFSFLKDVLNLDDSLIAITFKKWKQTVKIYGIVK